MDSNFKPIQQIEGRWDDLIRQPHAFAGRRVRVTVLPDEPGASSLQSEIQRWLGEGDALVGHRPIAIRSDVFGNALVEKFRKHGLVF